MPDGKESKREIVEVVNSGAVGIVLVKDDRVYLVRQYRKAIEKVLWRFLPGGWSREKTLCIVHSVSWPRKWVQD